jgi:hypothetical protein
VDGKLDTAPNIGEWASWLVPYIIRAKLRFDMTPSRRKLRGYLSIVHFSEPIGASARERALS